MSDQALTARELETLPPPEPGSFIVETPDGVFRYLEVRYAKARYDADAAWARLFQYEGAGFASWGHWKLLESRGSQ